MPTFIDTEPRLRVVEAVVNFDAFSSVNESIEVAVLPSKCRIVAVDAFKEVPFNSGTVQIGYLTTAGNRNTYATAEEIAATSAGTAQCSAWRSLMNGLLSSGPRRVYARYEGAALPTQGLIRLWITVTDVTPRGEM